MFRYFDHARISSVSPPPSELSDLRFFFIRICIRWLAAHGEWDKCARSVARLSGISTKKALVTRSVKRELREIRESIEADKTMSKVNFVLYATFLITNRFSFPSFLGNLV